MIRAKAPAAGGLPFMFRLSHRSDAVEVCGAWALLTKNAAYVVGRLAAAGVAPISVDVNDGPNGLHAEIHLRDVTEARLLVFGAGRMPAIESDDRYHWFSLRNVRVFSLK